jgi:ribose transport system permease protein
MLTSSCWKERKVTAKGQGPNRENIEGREDMTDDQVEESTEKTQGSVAAAGQPRSSSRTSLLGRPEAGVFITFVILAVFLSLENSSFLSGQNIAYTSRSFSFIAIAAIGEGLIIISGGLDLSVGSVMGLAGTVAAWYGTHGYGTAVALAAGLGVGCLVGFTNGVLIAKLKLNPFIVTLAMLNMVRSLVYVITQGYPLVGLPDSLTNLGQSAIVGIPVPVIIMLVIGAVFAWFMRSTGFGWHVFAIGGSVESARLAGVRVERLTILLYTLGGLLAAIGGVLLTARLGVGDASTGSGYELQVIAACIIGGVSLYGGIGGVFGILLGAALIGVLQNGLVLLGISTFWQQFALGAVILAAVIIDRIRTLRTGAARPAWASRLPTFAWPWSRSGQQREHVGTGTKGSKGGGR